MSNSERIQVSREIFESLAEQALMNLPKIFRKRIDNVMIVVEDQPTAELARTMKIRVSDLLGLYQGIPLTKRDTSYGMYPAGPDTITLFKQNIERECRTEDELIKKIKEVMLHEIGHYFGMNERQLQQAMKRFQT